MSSKYVGLTCALVLCSTSIGRCIEGLASGAEGAQSISSEVSPQVQDSLNLTAELLYKYSVLVNAKETGSVARSFRDNMLVPGIKRVAEVAGRTHDPELLYSAFALGSCDAVPNHSFEWASEVGGAADAFKADQIKAALLRIEGPGRQTVINAIRYSSPNGVAAKTAVALPKESTLENTGAMDGWSGGKK